MNDDAPHQNCWISTSYSTFYCSVPLLLHVCVLFQVLELDENNEKAFFRRGEARLHRNEFSIAKEDFQKVLQVNPANQAARTQIIICQNKIKEHHEQDKKIYANMFQKFAEQDAKVCKLWVKYSPALASCVFFSSLFHKHFYMLK